MNNLEQQPNTGYLGPVAKGEELVVRQADSQELFAPASTRVEQSEVIDKGIINDTVGDAIRLGVLGRKASSEQGITPPWQHKEEKTKEHPKPKAAEEHKNERFQLMADAVMEGGSSDDRPVTYFESRRLAKIDRRKQKAFRQSAEQLRIGSLFGRTPGTRGPLFLRRHITHDSTGQQTARNNRFGRVSDIDNEKAFNRRLAEGDYSPIERGTEMRARQLFQIAEEAQRDLLEANLATRNGTDTFVAKTRRLGRRIKRAAQRRSGFTPN